MSERERAERILADYLPNDKPDATWRLAQDVLILSERVEAAERELAVSKADVEELEDWHNADEVTLARIAAGTRRNSGLLGRRDSVDSQTVAPSSFESRCIAAEERIAVLETALTDLLWLADLHAGTDETSTLIRRKARAALRDSPTEENDGHTV
jgi:hypothetical protein